MLSDADSTNKLSAGVYNIFNPPSHTLSAFYFAVLLSLSVPLQDPIGIIEPGQMINRTITIDAGEINKKQLPVIGFVLSLCFAPIFPAVCSVYGRKAYWEEGETRSVDLI